ncbi:MAG: AAA family ATPase [Thermovirgaceae bacterium]|nr:AAA family ATPase [Synergistales bacterium]MDY0179403.1 AAA family ATPase [Synergistaceae bacterium]HRW86964.1 AAA family ATPase [Thermovirgaceae bacterium]MDD3133163.1 AAA family ATPase [Synergistales bacterium]MDD3829854.1 AAA family ATPase [Synergistales bacterium]
MKLLKTVAVANQKGGVGKTTCCVNLAAELGRQGKKVLVLDIDPQGNSTSGLGVDVANIKNSMYHVILDEVSPTNAIIQSSWEGVWVLPATLDLAGSEVELAGVMSRETRLARHMNAMKDFDIGFIDCPPSLGLLTVNALVASDSLMVPIQCEYYALEGVGQLMRTVSLVQRYLNENLKLDGVVLTMFDTRTNLSREVADEVKNQFKEAVFETIIPRNVRLSEAPSYGKPICYYDQGSAGAAAFRNLAEEVQDRWLAQGH